MIMLDILGWRVLIAWQHAYYAVRQQPFLFHSCSLNHYSRIVLQMLGSIEIANQKQCSTVARK